MQLYMSWYIISFFGFTFLNIFIFSSTLVLTFSYRRNLYTFYWINIPFVGASTAALCSRFVFPLWFVVSYSSFDLISSWWRYQMELFSALLALCAGNSPAMVNSPHKGQWRGALRFSLLCAWPSGWVNNRDGGDLRRHRTHYGVTAMHAIIACIPCCWHMVWLELGYRLVVTSIVYYVCNYSSVLQLQRRFN